MATNVNPRSLRFDELTEDRLKAWSILTGESISDSIRRFVTEGLDRESEPAALNARVDAYARRVADFGATATSHRDESVLADPAPLSVVDPTDSAAEEASK